MGNDAGSIILFFLVVLFMAGWALGSCNTIENYKLGCQELCQKEAGRMVSMSIENGCECAVETFNPNTNVGN